MDSMGVLGFWIIPIMGNFKITTGPSSNMAINQDKGYQGHLTEDTCLIPYRLENLITKFAITRLDKILQ